MSSSALRKFGRGLLAGSLCACGSASDGRDVASSAAGVAPPLPIAWTQPAWFVDPANSTGAARDSNACTTAAAPCLSFEGLATIWGATVSPRLRQNTTITFLSSQFNSNDPVIFTPAIENGVTVTLQGALGTAQQVGAGALTVIAKKNRSSAQLLDVALPAGAAPGLLVVDTTRGSRAWVFGADSSNRGWLLSQSMVAAVPGGALPVEDDGWSTGDAVVVYDPVTVNIDEVAPTIADGAMAPVSSNLDVAQMQVLDPMIETMPQELYAQSITVGPGVTFVESSIGKVLTNQGGTTGLPEGFINDDFALIFFADTPGPQFTVWGGQGRYGFLEMKGGVLDGDFVVGPTQPGDLGAFGLYSMTIGSVYLEPGTSLLVWADSQLGRAGQPGVVWGGGLVLVTGSAALTYSASATAAATFVETGGLYLDSPALGVLAGTITSPTTACAVDGSGSDGWTCGIPVTPANLDLPVSEGGFGGDAVVAGGGSINNRGGF